MTASAGAGRVGASLGGVLLALAVGAASAAGGATGDLERVALAAAACVLAALVAVGARSLDPIARPSAPEAALLALAAWSLLAAVPWPDGLSRALAPYAWHSRAAATGTADGVAPSLDVGATARAAIVLASIAFLAASARVVVAKGGLPWLLRALAVVATAHAGLAFLRGRYGEDDTLLFGWVSDNPLNSYGTFPSRTQFSAFVAVLLVAPVGLWARPKGPLDRPLAALAALATATAVVASGSRAGVLGLVLAAGVLVLGARGRARGGLAVAFVVAVAALVVARAAGFAPLVRILPLRGDEGDRLDIWRGSLDLAREQPVVGVGLDAFRYAYAGGGRGPTDHWVGMAENDALQGLAEVGVVGVLLGVLVLVAALRSLRRDARAGGAGALPLPAALAGFAALLPLTVTSSPLHDPGVAAAAVLAWAAARGLATSDATAALAPPAGGVATTARYGSDETEASWRAS